MWKGLLVFVLAATSNISAQPGPNIDAQPGPFAPVVEMTVTLPGGRIEHVAAPDSGLAHLVVGDVEYAFRPTILDSRPWHHVVVTIFRRVSPTAATEILGEVELKTWGTSVVAETSPAFEVAVTNVGMPPSSSQDQSASRTTSDVAGNAVLR